jgi:hypothetical protein
VLCEKIKVATEKAPVGLAEVIPEIDETAKKVGNQPEIPRTAPDGQKPLRRPA